MTKTKKKFDVMTAAEKRVAIAKDVLKQLKAKRLHARRRLYLKRPRSLRNELWINSPYRNRPLEDVLAKIPKCEACAIGSMFVCAVERFNELGTADVGTYISSWNMRSYLRRFFNGETLGQIEAAFETDENGDPADTLRRIMLNISRNGGKFIPKSATLDGLLV